MGVNGQMGFIRCELLRVGGYVEPKTWNWRILTSADCGIIRQKSCKLSFVQAEKPESFCTFFAK